MSCVESLLADMAGVMEDRASSDLSIRCQDKETRVHKLILSARSPVFRAMLSSDMVEKLQGVIHIEDACMEVVQQMVRYLYTAKVDHDFTRTKELLVLANKYQVLELVNYCSSRIFESLSEDNALEIGMFGEMHNSEVLINRCAKYICYDMTDSLGENWMERLKESPRLMLHCTALHCTALHCTALQESPRLMLQIIKNLRDVHENKLHEIRRMEAGIEQWVHGSRVNAVAFEVDAKVWLRGIGLYGAKDGSKFTVNIKVFLNDDCLLEETKEYSSNHSASPVKLVLSTPVKIKPNKRYDITTELTGGPTLYGRNAHKVVSSTGVSGNTFDVTFFTSPLDQNGGGTEMGQVPSLFFRAPFTY